MGCDKSKLRFQGRILVDHIRTQAQAALPEARVRVIRKDAVARCGPLGGVVTALRVTRAEAVMFLACDMPFVTKTLLRTLARMPARPVFASQREGAGFPFLLPRAALPVVAAQIEAKQFSLQSLARVLRARRVRVHQRSRALINVNTPDEAKRVGLRVPVRPRS
jgi:molybdopterin-guanine dinucleotide biosynthesis protein A